MNKSPQIPAGFQILTAIKSLFVFLCSITALSLIALSQGIQDEALAQTGSPSGYEFVTKWGSHVYITDVNNHRIQKFSNNGSFISAFGSEGEDDGQFIQPEGIDVDSEGNIYVADTGNFRIQVFSQ